MYCLNVYFANRIYNVAKFETEGVDMDITLTTKDADFILSFIRKDIVLLEERLKKLSTSRDNLMRHFNGLGKIEDGVDEEIKMLKKCSTLLGTEVENNLHDTISDLTHCIELLTVGSEVKA